MVQVSPSPHDKKDLDLEGGAALRLRRQSVDLGLNLQVSSGDAPKHTLLDLKALTNGQVEAIAESLILAIKGCSGVEQAMEAWTSDELPQAESEEAKIAVEFMKRVLAALARKIKKWLKMARIGLMVRIAVALILNYEDFTTDILVTKEYKDTGREGYFQVSLYIIVLGISLHCFIAFQNNRKKGFKVRILRFLMSLFMMTPIVDGYNVWTGKEHDNDELFNPDQMLVLSRVIELIFESLPESVLQSYIILNSTSSQVSSLMIFSIFASLAAAAFIMTDSSVSYERNYMVSHLGPYAHPVFGYIPSKTINQVGLYLGFFGFYFGYLGLNILSLTTMVTYFSVWLIPPIHAFEFLLFVFTMQRQGNFYYLGLPVGSGVGNTATNLVVLLGYYLLLAFLPWTQLRIQILAGGRLFGAWILWTMAKNVLLVLSATLLIADGDHATQLSVLVVTLSLCVVGIFLVLYNAHSTHRYTFYSNDELTSYSEFDWSISGTHPYHTSIDSAMGRMCFVLHPSYMRKDKLIKWVVNLNFDSSPIFKSATSLPSRISKTSSDLPHSYLFHNIRTKVAWYKDAEAVEAVEEKLIALEQQLKARQDAEATYNATLTSSRSLSQSSKIS
mmetsp:Transcript_17485/g.35534  ORF Transcript_17485/g.35534 Transcript_17485/m.35534 type:complete len:615 (-) Transcript_17485:23-1867(-)